jgi:hypothetical protein
MRSHDSGSDESARRPIPQARKSKKADHEIGYSFAPSPLDNAKRIYFRKRITSSLQKAFGVVRDPNQPSTVPDLMLGFYGGVAEDDDFVLMSQGIAEHLYLEQGGISTAGLVAVVEGTIGIGKTPGRCLAVLKLEMEPGIHIEEIEVDGKKTYEVTLEDVTLTEGTRVFKASLFPRLSAVELVSGLVSDDQLESTTIGRDVAEFFLRRSSGARWRQPQVSPRSSSLRGKASIRTSSPSRAGKADSDDRPYRVRPREPRSYGSRRVLATVKRRRWPRPSNSQGHLAHREVPQGIMGVLRQRGSHNGSSLSVTAQY